MSNLFSFIPRWVETGLNGKSLPLVKILAHVWPPNCVNERLLSLS